MDINRPLKRLAYHRDMSWHHAASDEAKRWTRIFVKTGKVDCFSHDVLFGVDYSKRIAVFVTDENTMSRSGLSGLRPCPR